MKYLKLFEEYNNRLDKVISDIESIYRKDDFAIKEYRISNNILHIILETPRTEIFNYDILRKIKSEILELPYVRDIFDMGFKTAKKTEEFSSSSIRILVKPGISNNLSDNFIGKLIKYIYKYEIKSMDELIKDLTYVVRDLNRYIKIYHEKELYSYKKTFLKYLYHNDYIESVTKHKYGNDELILLKTKIDDISFHILRHEAYKIGINYENLPNTEESDKKEYVEEDIINKEKIFEALPILNQINNSQLIKSAENIFN